MPISPTIFREYLGSSKDGSQQKLFPAQIIDKKVPEFHFILAFAKETYDANKKGDGKFDPSWDITVFNVESIKNLKKDYPNAKVVISIGGPKDDAQFYAGNRNTWLSNATESIRKIITDHNIDGIDINYESILSSTEDFLFCIGGLIKKLKDDKVIKVASIAPSAALNSQYSTLFKVYKNQIDWVDYKFYNQPLSTKDEYVELYNKLSSDDYPSDPSVLLAGFSTNTTDANYLSQETFLNACQALIDRDLLPGIFVSDADYSRATAYPVEKLAQQLIVNT